MARLAARAAEALCRLRRGQGLEGAYVFAPQGQLAMAPVGVLQLALIEPRESLPAATARDCAPHWLKAAGWLAALLSDATAAAMGRLPAAQRPEQPRSHLDDAVVVARSRAGSWAVALRLLLAELVRLAHNDTYSLDTLPAAAPADVRRRLYRCGLAASLDHTLRLAYSTQDIAGVGQTGVAKALDTASVSATGAIDAGLVPFLPLMGSNGCSSRGVQGEGCGGQAAGPQLGLLLTLSKRAAMVARALEAGAGPGAAAARGEGAAGAQQQSQQLAEGAAEVLALLAAAMRCVRRELCERVAAAAAGSGAGGSSEAVCNDEVHEALALASRAVSSLAAQLAWELAADVETAAFEVAAEVAAAGGPTGQVCAAWQAGTRAVCGALACSVRWWRHPLPLLPPAQVLVCQPHRLLAAACTLAAALPTQPNELGEHKQRLCALLASAVAVLASHETLSGRARGWLAPPLAAAATSSDESCGGDGGGGGSRGSRGKGQQADPCAGCLAVPLLALVRQAAGTAPSYAAHTAALLRLAVGSEGTGAAAGEADGGFRWFAQEVAAAMVVDCCRDAQPRGEFNEVPMPDGSSPTTLLQAEGEGDGAGGMREVPPAPPAAALSGALPPPLALQPSRQGALTRLRVCGSSGCCNFAEESEGALPFKQCGGCRAVRYLRGGLPAGALAGGAPGRVQAAGS